MKIDDALIAYLEELSQLSLTEGEKDTAKENLGEILGYMDQLKQLDTTGVEALSHPFPSANRFREDVSQPSYAREKILANAPAQKDGYFKVPKTVE